MSDKVTLLFFDKDGNEVPEDSDKAVVQYRSDDPARPQPKESKAVTEPPADKAVKLSAKK